MFGVFVDVCFSEPYWGPLAFKALGFTVAEIHVIQLLQFAGVAFIGVLAVVAASVLVNRFFTGAARVREVREEGGGMSSKLLGELHGGQRRASSARQHGLHMSVSGGQVRYRAKSAIANHG